MSISITFRTAKQLKADDVFKTLADRGEKIMVTSQSFPCLKLGTVREALRGIEVTSILLPLATESNYFAIFLKTKGPANCTTNNVIHTQKLMSPNAGAKS